MEEALLRAIRESPDDLLPRQALGDWMLERDDPREQALGELIQTQCRMHAVPHYSAERLELAIRERELMNAHRWEWGRMFFPGVWRVGGVIPPGGVRRGQFQLHQGRDKPDDWPAEARGYRWVESLFWEEWGAGVAAGPLTSSVRVLTLGGPIDPREPEGDLSWLADVEGRYPLLDDLFSAGGISQIGRTTLPSRLRRLTGALPDDPDFFKREWPRLQHLGLRGCTPTSAAMVALCREDRLSGLRSARLEMHADCLHLLASAPWLSRLDTLSLRFRGGFLSGEMVAGLPPALERLELDVPLSTAAVSALARWPGLPRLRSLTLDGDTGEETQAIFQRDGADLRELSLLAAGADFSSLPALARCPMLAKVESLACSTDDTVGVGTSPHLARVVRLHIEQCGINGLSVADLLQFPALRILEMPGCAVAPDNIGELVALSGLAKLSRLDLSRNDLNDGCVARLAGCRHLTGLRELDISGNELTDACVPALAGGECLPGLRRLRISGDIRKHATAAALASSEPLANLVELDLRGCSFGPRSLALLRERFGDALVV